MIDMEQVVMDLLKEKVPGVKWSVGYPQSFKKVVDGLGCVTQMDNSVKITTTDAVDSVSNIAVQIQTWCDTPERRNALDLEVDTAMQSIGISRSGLSHFAEPRNDETLLRRSVLLYSGAHDNKTGEYFKK